MGRNKDKERDKEKKKKKDKDRDRERSKKDKEHGKDKSRHKADRKPSTEESDDEVRPRGRERNGSPSRSKRDKEREEPKRKHSPDHRTDHSKRSRHEVEKEDKEKEEAVVNQKVSSDSSLSIVETNKLRAQLGLKPLDVGGDSGTGTGPGSQDGGGEGEDDEEKKKKEPQHAPPKNIGEEAAAEKMREKLKLMRESREIAKKLSSVKGLGEKGREEEGASNWVNKMREKDREKEMAKKRAKLLEEMDDEFGIGDLVKEEFTEATPSSKEATPSLRDQAYSAKSLSGMRIQHKEDHFKEGRDIVLTLKDVPVLDDEQGDVLINVNMVDEEHASRNVQLKKGLPGYIPYEEEFDEYGNPKTRSLLYKYDEEIEGVKKQSFVLGQKGTFDVGKIEREKEESKRLLEQRAIKLEMPQAVIASEYYSSEEMVQFKKRKRRKKKEKFKADDLLPLGNEEEEGKDHGSRRKPISETENEPSENWNESMEVDVKPDLALLDDHDSNTDTALARTRRLLKGSSSSGDRKMGAALVANMIASKVPKIKQEKLDDDEDTAIVETIVLDTTAEFCRNIGEEEGVEEEGEEKEPPEKGTVKISRGQEEEEMEDDDDDDNESDDDKQEGGWMEVDPSTDPDKARRSSKDADVLELDVVMSTGVAAALQMANKKGFVDNEEEGKVKKKRDGSSKTIIEGLGVRDWEYERDRGRERERERDHGREMPFAEKSGYTPDVNIEYVDNMGRLLTPKEAFRHMSHKFHGKASGKKKSEKRMKRLQEEFLLNHASTVDTPLQTVELFRKRQENSQSPYVVLTGTQQQHSLNMAELTKRK